MYSGTYPEKSSGAVKAFEDAYAKEEFLRRSADGAIQNTCTGKPSPDRTDGVGELRRNDGFAPLKDDDERKNARKGIFGDIDTGDLILILLIVFFLLDGDSENDKIIPVLLAVILLI